MARWIFAVLILIVCRAGMGQQTNTPSLSTILNDANYSFNRYEELAGEMDCSALRTATEGIRQACRDLVQITTKNVRDTKESLNRAIKVWHPSNE